MNIQDLKSAVAELIEEGQSQGDITADALDDYEQEKAWKRELGSLSSHANDKEKKILKAIVMIASKDRIGNSSFKRVLAAVTRSMGLDPDKDFTLDHADAAEYVCAVLAMGNDGYFIQLGKEMPEKCPKHWGTKGKQSIGGSVDSGTGTIDKAAARDFLRRMPASAQPLWDEIEAAFKAANRDGRRLKFRNALSAAKAGAHPYITSNMKTAEAVASLQFLAEDKKRGFGEGEPPEEEIYKKREVVQEVGEVDLETPDVADELSQMTKDQSDATKNQGEAHEQAAEAAKQRQAASKAWKDAKITQVKAIDAAEKAAAEEAKATDAQSKAMDAAQKAADAVEKAQGEKEKYLDVAKQAAEQEQQAAKAAEDAAATEEEAEKAMQDSSDKSAAVEDELSGVQGKLGDAINNDKESQADAEEEKAKEEEEAKDEEEEARKAEIEAEKEERDAEREQADKEAAADAEAKESEKESEEEEEPVSEMLKAMVREVISERKWGDDKPTPQPSTREKLAKSGLTADELRGMVLKTVMNGEEERDKQMIDLLSKMLKSLQSIEYHSTPAKGTSSRDASTRAAAWLNEGTNKVIVLSIPSLIAEMRDNGMDMLADDNESFFKWALANTDLTMQEIKNEADAQIADLQKMLRKMGDHITGKEDSLEKQKLRGEVPGHH